MLDDFENLIFSLPPADTPFGGDKAARMLRTSKGGSMRKQRRRKAKCVKFTASTTWRLMLPAEKLHLHQFADSA